MNVFPLASVGQLLGGSQLLWGALWLGLALLTIALVVLMRTRWGQSQPLGKCLALSLLAHLLLAGYATTVEIVHSTMRIVAEQRVRITTVECVAAGTDKAANGADSASPVEEPWEAAQPVAIPSEHSPQPPPPVQPLDSTAAAQPPTSEPLAVREAILDTLPSSIAADPLEANQLADTAETQQLQPAELANQVEAPAAQQQAERAIETPPNPEPAAVPQPNDATPAETATLTSESNLGGAGTAMAPSLELPGGAPELPPPELPEELTPTVIDSRPLATVVKPEAGHSPPAAAAASLDPAQDPAPPATIPPSYEQRISERLATALREGGGPETEAAVDAALAWLASHQNADGRWDAARFGAGQEQRIGGEDRRGAGAGADTGVTGLALLAMLGAGNTQLRGDHQSSVRRGLEFLLASQHGDGNLGGRATLFAKMYCHAMATIALGEAYGLTGDLRLRDPLRRAIAYTLKAQHPGTGGWRYQSSEPGDTSQLGWQLMALRSAELAGLSIPRSAKEGMARFLQSVACGAQGGLASYRPEDRATRSMTAEALACRQFLNLRLGEAAEREGVEFILQELPGTRQSNLYYWYYATLALYQLGGQGWQRWNAALKETLLATQRHDGDLAGSWDTTDVWGGYGGRVYTTALGALCLEVYYRYLPLYGRTIARGASDAATR